MKKIMFIDYFVCSRRSSNEFIDSVKSLPFTDQSLVKCKSINELHDRNECLESQIANEVNILQGPSSSDIPE